MLASTATVEGQRCFVVAYPGWYLHELSPPCTPMSGPRLVRARYLTTLRTLMLDGLGTEEE